MEGSITLSNVMDTGPSDGYVMVQIFFWFNIFLPVWFLFYFVAKYKNESETKKNKHFTGLNV